MLVIHPYQKLTVATDMMVTNGVEMMIPRIPTLGGYGHNNNTKNKIYCNTFTSMVEYFCFRQ